MIEGMTSIALVFPKDVDASLKKAFSPISLAITAFINFSINTFFPIGTVAGTLNTTAALFDDAAGRLAPAGAFLIAGVCIIAVAAGASGSTAFFGDPKLKEKGFLKGCVGLFFAADSLLYAALRSSAAARSGSSAISGTITDSTFSTPNKVSMVFKKASAGNTPDLKESVAFWNDLFLLESSFNSLCADLWNILFIPSGVLFELTGVFCTALFVSFDTLLDGFVTLISIGFLTVKGNTFSTTLSFKNPKNPLSFFSSTTFPLSFVTLGTGSRVDVIFSESDFETIFDFILDAIADVTISS
mmetsp:Transcript_25794/g.24639  ORF Transcript_25794/g.24639 Transcript_25794/m.24639 type:complete len:300 (+) Transcript_25794:68-967(+)